MTLRLACVRDFRAEGWPSMDLCADQLLAHLPLGVIAEDVSPMFRRRFGRIPFSRGVGYNADRLLNRHVFLPRIVRSVASRADFVHIVDHSYAHLARSVPPERCGVYCHDLDAFRSILDPVAEPRPLWFRRLAERTLEGLKRAAVVFHSTAEIRERILRHRLVAPERLIHAPYGVAAEFTPAAECSAQADSTYLLHVGSNIPRKRLDVLLDVFATLWKQRPALKLIQVGGPWPAEQREQIERLGIGPAVSQQRDLSRRQLAELYRRAAAVLVTSEAEGFGLPVIEALACGAPVVASDIPVLREVGGTAAEYCSIADIPSWAAALTRIIDEPTQRMGRVEQAAQYTWSEHARIICTAYDRLAKGLLPRCESSS